MASFVAMLALFAQLLLIQVSTGHMLRLAVAGGLPADICSAQSPSPSRESEPQGGNSHAGAFPCPVCAAAATGIADTSGPAPTAGAPEAVLRLAIALAQPLLDSRQSGIRPPAQAPPQA